MVISKLTEGRATHIPYRDSKLTRLLQSSLSGHGRVSLICTVTPASSNTEETHNTLKFAHRAKRIEIQAAQNKIIDEKSLIKKYQNDIRLLKEELEQLKKGIVIVPQHKDDSGDDIILLKQKLEDGQFKLQSRLEEEEEAKAALLARIQRLTKLILVSNKSSQSARYPHRLAHRRRHSFGEEELSYLPHKRRDLILDDENKDMHIAHDGIAENSDNAKEENKSQKNGLLIWLKLRTSSRSIDQIDLFREQKNILSREVELHSSTLKHLSEAAAKNPKTQQIHSDLKDEMRKLREEIQVKSEQITSLEKLIADMIVANHDKMDKSKMSQTISELVIQLNEKSFELEVKTADNRIIQEQLTQKSFECETLHAEVTSLKQQFSDAFKSRYMNPVSPASQQHIRSQSLLDGTETCKDSMSPKETSEKLLLRSQSISNHTGFPVFQKKATEIEELKQRLTNLTATNDQLEHRNTKLAEESSYAKGLASAAAVELKMLSEEVAKLMNQKERLCTELTAMKNSTTHRRSVGILRNGRRESQVKQHDQSPSPSDLMKELAISRGRETMYEAALLEKEQREMMLRREVEESKQREAYLENELANMWVLVTKLENSQGVEVDLSEMSRDSQRTENW